MNTQTLQLVLGMAGTVAFAVTAVLAVTPRNVDLFGACVLGIITAIGGGTIRDVILDVPVFWASDPNYIWVALIASAVAFYGNRLMAQKHVYQAMLYLDGIGVSMFAIQGAHKALSLQFGLPLGPILLGIVTAIGGGLTRDVLVGNPTLLMKKELYAVPITVGCTLFVLLAVRNPADVVVYGAVCSLLIFAIRSAAIHWNLSVPRWMLAHAKRGRSDSVGDARTDNDGGRSG